MELFSIFLRKARKLFGVHCLKSPFWEKGSGFVRAEHPSLRVSIEYHKRGGLHVLDIVLSKVNQVLLIKFRELIYLGLGYAQALLQALSLLFGQLGLLLDSFVLE